MLKKLRLHNFRTYLNAELALTQRHLIIGRNNSGKTNLCAALRFLRASATHDLATAVSEVPGGVTEITNWVHDSNKLELTCECELLFDETPHSFVYDLTLEITSATPPTGSVTLRVASERLTVDGPALKDAVLLESNGREAQMLHEESDEGFKVQTLAPTDATMLSKLYELETNRRAIAFRRYLSSWAYYSLSPDAMRFGWRASGQKFGAPQALQVRGENLAVALFHLKNLNERSYRRVIKSVQTIEPDLEAVNFLVSPDQSPVPAIALGNRSYATWEGLSDGTLRALGLAFIAEVVGALLVVVEEPENGIYPGLLRPVFDAFEERASGAQLLFTSHSPYFINFFDGSRESVTLLRRRNERTEVLSVPPADDNDPDRPLLAEQYSMELFD